MRSVIHIALTVIAAVGSLAAQTPTWTQIATATIPNGRTQHQLTYDNVRGKMVMFGGVDSSGATLLSDTWEFDGVDWNLVTTSNAPSARRSHAMVYDK